MKNITNYIIIFIISILVFCMMHIVYKCKKRDNELLIEKYYNFYYHNKYETFIDYNNEKYNAEQNNCINKWIKNNNGMEIYLNTLNDETRKIIINSIANIQCKTSKNTIVKKKESNKPVTKKNQEERNGVEEVENNGDKLTKEERDIKEGAAGEEDVSQQGTETKEEEELSQNDSQTNELKNGDELDNDNSETDEFEAQEESDQDDSETKDVIMEDELANDDSETESV